MTRPAPSIYVDLLRPAEVAAMFGVDTATVSRWAARGMLTVFRTPGGHRRYDHDEVAALFEQTKDQGSGR